METQARYVLVGLFTVLVVAAALLFGMWLGQPRERSYNYYEIAFTQGVNGLSKGSMVQYSGIRVGEVDNLWLDSADPRKVWVHIRVQRDAPIKEDTRARLALANIAGQMTIQLRGGSPDSPNLTRKDHKPPIIIADPTPLDTLLENGEDLMSNINHLLVNANRLFSEDNANKIGQTLDHLEVASRALAGRSDDLSQALAQLNQLGGQANQALQEITRLSQNADKILSEDGRQLIASTTQSIDNLSKVSNRLDTLLANSQGALNNGMQGFSELGPTLSELHGTLKSLRQVTEQLKDNPSDFLLGREKLREFRP